MDIQEINRRSEPSNGKKGGFLRSCYLCFVLVATACLQVASEAEAFEYKVGPDDVLAITVYDNPDLSGDFSVSSDGSIVYPLLGQVPVAGSGIGEIKNTIARMLQKDYLYNPIVSVTVKEYKSQKVKVLGNVGKPGIYYLDSPTRLFDLLSKAEGLSGQVGKIMRGQKARIVRQKDDSDASGSSGKIETIHVDLYQLLVEGREDVNIYLSGGDVVYIPKTKTIHVIGEVKQSGSFPYEENMTVLKAITLAGGGSKKTFTKNIYIRRMEDGREIKIKAGMEEVLFPDDIVEVPLNVQVVHVIGEVKKPGAYPFEEKMTVLKAITLAGGATKKASTKNTVVKRIENGKEEEARVSMSDLLNPEDIVEVPLSFW